MRLFSQGELRKPGGVRLSDSRIARVARALDVIFLISLVVAAYLYWGSLYSRSFVLLLELAAVGVLLFARSVYAPGFREGIVVLEIILYGIVLRATVFWEFPGSVGIDPWYHQVFIQLMETSGRVPQFGGYQSFPIMHIWVLQLQELTGLDLRISYFFVGVIQTLGFVFVYIVARRLMGTACAAVAILFLMVASDELLWGAWIIPMTFGLVLFVFLFYLLSRKGFAEATARSSALILLVLAVSVLTHPLSAAFAVLLVTAFAAAPLLGRIARIHTPASRVSLILPLIGGIMAWGYWMYTTGLVGYVVESAMQAFSVDRFAAQSQVPKGPVYEWYLRGIYIFVAVLWLLGVLTTRPWRRSERKDILPNLSVVSGAILVITFAVGILPLTAVFPERWFSFAFVTCAVFVGVSFVRIGKGRKTKAIALALVGVMCLTMIGSWKANVTDSDSLVGPFPRAGLMYSELAAISFVADDMKAGRPVLSDTYLAYAANVTSGKFQDGSALLTKSEVPTSGYFLLRYELYRSPVWVAPRGEITLTSSYLQSLTGGASAKIYDSGSTAIFLFR